MKRSVCLQMAAVLSASLMLFGCSQAEPGLVSSSPAGGTTSAGESTAPSASTQTTVPGVSESAPAPTATTRGSVPTKKGGTRSTARKTDATTKAATTAPPSSGHISGSDTSVEPVRGLDEILANLPQDARACNAYDLEKYLKPYWQGNIVYNESLNFIKDPKTGRAEAPLLFDALEVLSVRDSALGIEYEEGRDYIVSGNKLVLTPQSRIPCFSYDEIYFSQEKPGESWALKKGGYTYFTEGSYFHSRQVAVTYLHSQPWKGYKPTYQGANLPNTLQKLKSGQPVKIVFFGDSITKGANASGMFDVEPRMPIWADMVTAMLKKAYPRSQITTYNPSVNAASTTQAMRDCKVLVADQKPDLVIVGFGMNDGADASLPPDVFQNNLKNIMDMIGMLHSDKTDFLLLSTTLPNPEIVLGTASWQSQYSEVMFELERKGVAGGKGGVVVGDMTAIHQYMLQSKRFFDMTANNVNHPNDFLIRAYAQLVCSMLIENFGK